MTSERHERLDAELRAEAADLRARPAPGGLHATVLARCRERSAQVTPLAATARRARHVAAALVLVAAAVGGHLLASRAAPRQAPVPVRVLQEVTAEPVAAARRLGDVPLVRRVGADVEAGLVRAGARTSDAARALAQRLAGPLRLLARWN